MKRAYHDLMEQISVPSGLNDRVLQTARQEAAGVGTRRKRTALRAAVCAACALALVLGTVRLGVLLGAGVLLFMFLQGLLHLCIRLVPGQAAVFTSLAPQVVVMKRTAWDTALAIAFFLCAALYQLYKTCQSSYNNTIPAAHRSRADGPR